MNPAYMTRQVFELAQKEEDVQGHITSLNPIRPANAPDPWETHALEAFQRGEAEVSHIETLRDISYMRLMRPLFTDEEVCPKCHEKQGNELGDIRGGISASVPMAPLWAVARPQMILSVAGHLLLWSVNLAGIVMGTRCVAGRLHERNQAEEVLVENAETLRRLALELETAEDRERRRLAEYLHDQLGQSLAAIRVKFAAWKGMGPSHDREMLLTEVEQLVDETIEETRSITLELSPPILFELGLGAALEGLGETLFEEVGTAFEFQDDGRCPKFKDAFASASYRITREILLNVVKHAQAKRVSVSVSADSDVLRVEVRDNGIGMERAHLEKALRGLGDTYGLFNVRERLMHMRGSVEIESSPGKGTHVTMTVPIQRSVPSRNGDLA